MMAHHDRCFLRAASRKTPNVPMKGKLRLSGLAASVGSIQQKLIGLKLLLEAGRRNQTFPPLRGDRRYDDLARRLQLPPETRAKAATSSAGAPPASPR